MCLSLPCLNFLSLDWRLQSLFPPALKNTFHFNVAAARKVICHSIMTKQTQRHFTGKCADVHECVCVCAHEGSLGGEGGEVLLRPCELIDLFEVWRLDSPVTGARTSVWCLCAYAGFWWGGNAGMLHTYAHTFLTYYHFQNLQILNKSVLRKSHVANMLNVTFASQTYAYERNQINLSCCGCFMSYSVSINTPFLTTYVTTLRREIFLFRAWGLQP